MSLLTLLEGKERSVDRKEKVVAGKSRVRNFATIKDALKKGSVGQMFSTKGSKRLYVITKQKWGTSKQQQVGGKIAKGFSPGTIPASYKDVKGFAQRTLARHGKEGRK